MPARMASSSVHFCHSFKLNCMTVSKMGDGENGNRYGDDAGTLTGAIFSTWEGCKYGKNRTKQSETIFILLRIT
jgi:hypothetical protein